MTRSPVSPPGKVVTGAGVDPGYVLVAPAQDTITYLLDKKGAVFHHWPSSNIPGMAVYLLPNGNLLRAENLRPLGETTAYWLHADSATAHKILVNNDGYVGGVSNCEPTTGNPNPTSFVVLDAPFNPSEGSYGMEPGTACGPTGADQLAAVPSSDYQCDFEGSVQLLDNGNLMICSGLSGYLYELAPGVNNGPWQVVWQFNLTQGAFRCRQYNIEYVEEALRTAGGTGI